MDPASRRRRSRSGSRWYGQPATFQTDFIRAKLQERQPVFKTLDTSAGKVVVEAFPFRLPSTLVQAGETGEAPQVRQRRQFGVFEIAAFVDSAAASLWPLQRSLILNSSAALALFALIIVIGMRFRSYVEGRQIEQQLEIARGVQRDLLPAAERVSKDFELAADCIAASRVGGDFYDAIPTEGNGAAFVLGDVSGKGIPAALLMGVMHGAIRSSSWTESTRRHEEATRQINRLLCERASGERYASMFWSYFDPETHLIRYINAGHFPPVLFRAAQPNNPVRLEEGGPVLGLLPYAMFEQGSVRLDPGDVLVLYSDGVVEAANSADDQFGEARLLEIVQSSLDRSAEEIRNRILAAVETFTSHSALDDDRTLLVIRYTGAAIRSQSPTEPEFAGVAA